MSETLRVLTIGHSYTVGVNRGIVREVAEDPGFDVTVAAPNAFLGDLRPVSLDPEPEGSQLKIVGLDVSRTRWIHTMKYDDRALRRLVTDGDFDVVHAWEEPYIYAGFQIARAVKETNSRFCFRTDQNIVKWFPPPFGYFERKTLSRAQGWIAGASLVYKAMLKRQYPSDLGQVINLGIDTQAFQPQGEAERAAVLDELKLEPPVIGYVGRLTESKGMHVLMHAIERVNASDWSLLLLGSGDYEDRIREWAQRRGWNDRVRIHLANHDEVPRYLAAMDMLVAPSQTRRNWREQFGRMLVEAFACGVPVIGSDSGEIPFVIDDAGLVVGEADIDGWAEAIEKLLTDRELRDELARRGLQRVDRYSVKSIAGRYRDFYRNLSQRAA